ncbi:MAG: UDP-3-O-[3-hydroxymyristoyl] glucosamine N-acyltransferase [Lentimonas sp.]|jgi:UDP-3-O-[3-hydroxymyristoyl] glucosamine N-acyltransferase
MAFVYTTQRILEIVGHDAECSGEFQGDIIGIASLSEAVEGDVSFLGNSKYRDTVAASQASVLLLPRDSAEVPQAGQLHIKVDSPSYALALLCRDMEKSLQPLPAPGVHPTAFVDEDAIISPCASIGPFCYIGKGAIVGSAVLEAHVCIGKYAKVGDESYVFAQVVVGDYCEVGPRNRLQPGCVIGSDGYGYEFREGGHQRIPQIGNVVTEADVDIGSNTTIDRARFGSTVIGTGTKVDNLVQIAHNVRIGKHCLIIAQVGISGSTVLGDGVVLAGQAGVAGHLTIGSGAIVAGGTGVSRSLEPQEKVRGATAEPIMLYNRIAVLQRRLPSLFKRFDILEKSVESLAERGTRE